MSDHELPLLEDGLECGQYLSLLLRAVDGLVQRKVPPESAAKEANLFMQNYLMYNSHKCFCMSPEMIEEE